MDKERLKYVLRQAIERTLPAVKPRHVDVPLDPPKVVTLTGVRRAAKTFLRFHTIRRKIDSPR
ncbi:MAG: hypothetical protein ACC662_08630 [Planctomycetota bacterium]